MGVIFLKTGTAQADALLFRSRGMTRLSDDDSDWPSQGNYPLPQSGVYSSDDMAGNCFSILGKFFPGRREGRQWTDSALRLTHDLRLCLRWPSCTSSPPPTSMIEYPVQVQYTIPITSSPAAPCDNVSSRNPGWSCIAALRNTSARTRPLEQVPSRHCPR
jgi:hypothetical protein